MFQNIWHALNFHIACIIFFHTVVNFLYLIINIFFHLLKLLLRNDTFILKFVCKNMGYRWMLINLFVKEWLCHTRFIHFVMRSEEHTSELQSRFDLVCRLLLEKKNFCNYLFVVII